MNVGKELIIIDTVGYGASYTNFVANVIAFSIHSRRAGSASPDIGGTLILQPGQVASQRNVTHFLSNKIIKNIQFNYYRLEDLRLAFEPVTVKHKIPLHIIHRPRSTKGKCTKYATWQHPSPVDRLCQGHNLDTPTLRPGHRYQIRFRRIVELRRRDILCRRLRRMWSCGGDEVRLPRRERRQGYLR